MKKTALLISAEDTLSPLMNDPRVSNYLKLDAILRFFEEAGMLPPVTFLDKLNVYDNCWENEDD